MLCFSAHRSSINNELVGRRSEKRAEGEFFSSLLVNSVKTSPWPRDLRPSGVGGAWQRKLEGLFHVYSLDGCSRIKSTPN